jgi:hypothetical protein
MLPILGVFVAAAVLFGLVHDQITARVSIEYFTIAHETIVRSESPTVLGLVWGVVATWWAGALGGIVVSLAAREGPWPRLSWREFVRPALILAAVMAVGALGAGAAGHWLAAHGVVPIVADYEDMIAPARQARFMAAVFAHRASYAVGLLGTVAIAVGALRARMRRGRVVSR